MKGFLRDLSTDSVKQQSRVAPAVCKFFLKIEHKAHTRGLVTSL